jgi:hypothetical protein
MNNRSARRPVFSGRLSCSGTLGKSHRWQASTLPGNHAGGPRKLELKMDKKIAGLLGAVGALASLNTAQAATPTDSNEILRLGLMLTC